ncbi:single-stranded DNA-binding protein [Microbacterium sp. SS28]|uniref:single-stranded DNA-binding protein n=1 Tax=Microbacterium sp. SS28 TaxID=2919948 RepID=UPI001FA9BABD|nr:single-stranded DNA-binding protein [Microbacterium sp. SS28]
MSDTITVIGNIATPPEHKRIAGGVAITTFRVASGLRRYDRATSTWVDAGTNWYTVSTFRSLAEHAMASFSKGDRIIVTGRLRLREWDTGAKKGITAEIEADAIGHDLLRGTTRFEKDATGGAAPAPDADPEPASDWPAVATSDGWAVPGTGGLEPVLVGAGSSSADSGEPEASDTPF